MKLAEIDWRILRGALAMLLIALALGIGMLVGSYYFWTEKQQFLTKSERSLRDIKVKYTTIDDEERIIEEYLPLYQELESKGIIGREQRLNWIEILREASRELKLPQLRYSIQTQSRYEPDFPVETGAFEIYASVMQLNLGLLHEGDLPRLLAVINRDAVGLYSVSKCAIERQGREFARQATVANLTANCALRWFTIRQRAAGA